MNKIKKIGILTSGGDCGGLNAAIRSIFFRAKKKYKMEVFGIRNGTLGLIKRPLDIEQLTYKSFKIHNPWLLENHLNNKSRKAYTISIPSE